EDVSLSEVVESSWSNVSTKDATLVSETDRTLRANRSQLQQVLENLFRNAVENAGEDVTVIVGDQNDGFFIEDDGPGIPPEKRTKALEPGYSTREESTGFGLAIVAEIVDTHGWAIRVADGRTDGARFEFTGVDLAD
ncbi:sensor histidine kinase, partial [Halorubrum vacuolatum]